MSIFERVSKVSLACVLACSCAGFALVGCNGSQSTSSTAQQTKTEVDANGGTAQQPESSSSAQSSSSQTGSEQVAELETVQVELTNNTGYDFVRMQVKSAGAAQYDPDQAYDVSFANGAHETFSIEVDPNVDTHDFMFVTEDDSRIGADGVNLATMHDITLRFEDGFGFVTYTDDAGEEHSTKEATVAQVGNESVETYDQQNQRGE